MGGTSVASRPSVTAVSAVFAAAALLLLQVSCRRSERVVMTLGGEKFLIEVARTPQQRQRGLMYRRRLGEREGMLFVFDRDQILQFWMKDTSVPLSLAYLSSSGRILEIHELKPYSLDVVSSRHFARYALEVPAGTFDRLGIKAGDTVRLPPGL